MNIRRFFMEQPSDIKKEKIDPNKKVTVTQEKPEQDITNQSSNSNQAQINQQQDPSLNNFQDPNVGMDPLTQNGYYSGGPELLVSDDPLENIDKMYRLKKIFVKTQSIKNILNKFTNPIFDDIRKQVTEANELLINVLIPNLPSYKDSIDKIMRNYESFLLSCSKDIDELYNKNKSKE